MNYGGRMKNFEGWEMPTVVNLFYFCRRINKSFSSVFKSLFDGY
jgi:hypothetical protein